jgi:hypothetical protein
MDILAFLKENNPNIKFLLENVVPAKKEFEIEMTQYIAKIMGFLINPIKLNASDFSVQQRWRNYWFNWNYKSASYRNPILLRDVIDYNLKNTDPLQYNSLISKRESIYLSRPYAPIDFFNMNCIGRLRMSSSATYHVYSAFGKSVSLLTTHGEYYFIVDDDGTCSIRLLSINEREKLMGLPIDYTKFGREEGGNLFNITRTAREISCGNGWQTSVLGHIFNQLIFEKSIN